MSVTWNLWHGCHKLSEGCQHCYVFRTDEKHGKNASYVYKTLDFQLPVKKDRYGNNKVPSGETVYTCFTSDFLLADADGWRPEAWSMIRSRPDLTFLFVTKRIHRLMDCVPEDWGKGYENVHIYCTVENQRRAEERLPLFLEAPVRHKGIICEPLLEAVDLSPWLGSQIVEVIVGGESGNDARLCSYDWVLELRRQCVEAEVSFTFKQTGAWFQKNGRCYRIPRKYQHSQAKKAGIDYRTQR